MKKLRLLVTTKCHNTCKGCCNNDWDLEKLPICNDFSVWNMIMITGGEPMLCMPWLEHLLKRIRLENRECKIILYTAIPKGIIHSPYGFTRLIDLCLIDGITATIHVEKDVAGFEMLERSFFSVDPFRLSEMSLRLNIFKGISEIKPIFNWTIKKDIEWIENCPLPEDETFMRLERMF